MGTVKYSGPIASFHCPTEATIRSLKVHFSPKQLGDGTPSPENVRPIEGRDGVTVHNDRDGIIIPEEYQKVEYLESTGNQWINTGIIGSPNIVVNCDIELPSDRTIGNEGILGSRQSSAGGRMYLVSFYGNEFELGLGDQDIIFQQGYKVGRNKKISVVAEYVNNIYSLIIDGMLTRTGSFSYEGNEYPMYLFACNNFGTAARYCASRVYKVTIYKNEVLVLNFIPCFRKSDNKPGMYDTVTQTFFTNQGKEEFICGPDVGETVEYEFGVLGKNKLDPNLCELNKFWGASGDKSGTTGWLIVDYIKVVPGQTYTITGSTVTSESPTAQHLFYDSDKQLISNIPAGINNQTFTVPNGCKYVRLSIKASSTDGLQLELGSTATAYEPYDPNKTVYGGWIDLITGEVCEEYRKAILNGNNAFGTPNDYDTYYRFVKNYSALGLLEPKDTQYPISNWLEGRASPNGVYIGSTKNVLLYFNKDLNISTSEILSAYLKEHPLEFIYELATPITYSLTPIQLQTFLGQNNIWSNADYVEVEYDLHETQDILARKQFIIASQPHVEKLAAAPLQNFVTDMVAPLKECKVHFEPGQEGEGNPSPDNVRPINGWNGLSIFTSGKILTNLEFEQGGINGITSEETIDSKKIRTKEIANLKTGMRYVMNLTTSNSNIRVFRCFMYDRTSDTVTNYSAKLNESFPYLFDAQSVTSYNDIRIRFVLYSLDGSDITPDSISNPTIELGSIATSYEPYTGTTIPITFPSEAGIIYGGYVDLVTGEVWKTWDIIDLGTCTWIQYSNNPSIFYTQNLNKLKEHSDQYTILCTAYPYEQQKYVTATNDKTINDSQQLNRGNVAIRDTNYTNSTSAEFKEAMNGIICAYKLATPILVATLTPIQLKTLRGTNNIWSNANGNIELSYWKH